MKTIQEKLQDAYPELTKWSYVRLERELQQLQAFLKDEQSSIGRSDFFYEQALIAELEKRDKEKLQ